MSNIADFDVLNDNFELLDGLFDKSVLRDSLLNYINWSNCLNTVEQKKWRSALSGWIERLKSDDINFPRCMMTVKQLLSFVHNLGISTAFTLYSNKHSIEVYKQTKDVKGGYDTVKAYDCHLTTLRIDGIFGLNVPLVVDCRLLYLPVDGISVTYTGKGFERVIKRVDDVKFDDVGRLKFNRKMKFIPFELIKLICSRCEINDKRYIRAWCQMVQFNVDNFN